MSIVPLYIPINEIVELPWLIEVKIPNIELKGNLRRSNGLKY